MTRPRVVTGSASGTTATVPAARSRTAAAIDVCRSLATASWCRLPTTRSSVVKAWFASTWSTSPRAGSRWTSTSG